MKIFFATFLVGVCLIIGFSLLRSQETSEPEDQIVAAKEPAPQKKETPADPFQKPLSQLRELLGDLSEIKIRTEGKRILIEGKLSVIRDKLRVCRVVDAMKDPNSINIQDLTQIASRTMEETAEKITKEIASNRLRVRAAGSKFYLEGIADNNSQRERAIALTTSELPNLRLTVSNEFTQKFRPNESPGLESCPVIAVSIKILPQTSRTKSASISLMQKKKSSDRETGRYLGSFESDRNDGPFSMEREVSSRMKLIHYLWKKKGAAAALKELRKLLAQDPDNQEALREFGICALETGSVEDAVKKLMIASKRDPDDWQTQLFLGRAYEEKGDLVSALVAYQKSSKLYPEEQFLGWFQTKLTGLKTEIVKSKHEP